MKNILSLFYVLFFCIGWSQSTEKEKTIEVTYIKAFKNHKDTTNTPPKKIKGLEYQLLFDKDESRFAYIEQMGIDGNDTNNRYVGRIGGSGIYYCNLKNSEKKRTVNLYDSDYTIDVSQNKIKWNLIKESKKILGYDCYKAEGKYIEYSNFLKKEITFNITAWYTPHIPVPYGPASYDGLPGLVLEASRSSFYFIANEINLDKNTKIKKPKEGKSISQIDYNELLFNNRKRTQAKD